MGRPPLEIPKSLPVSLRLPPEVKRAAEMAAKRDVRSLSSYLEKVLTDHLIAEGFLNEYGLALVPSGKSVMAARRAALRQSKPDDVDQS